MRRMTAGGMGVSLCYLRGWPIGAFGWGLLRLLVSDFRIGAREGAMKKQSLTSRRKNGSRYASVMASCYFLWTS